MALPVRDQLTYWGIASAVFLVLLYVLGNVLLPFILGAAIAYCLDPIADRLEAMGMSRILSTVTITVLAAVLFLALVLQILPTLRHQIEDLVQTVPTMLDNLQTFLQNYFPALLDEESRIRQSLANFSQLFQEKSGEVLTQVLSSAASLINILVLVVLVPVITFYLLLDWDRMVARIDDLLPRDHAPVIRHLAKEIDRTLASFIRGQGTVCLILGTFYAVSLMLAGLNFGLVVGAIAGLITFIPYVGALVGGALALGLAFFQFWGDWHWIALIAGIFIVGQFVEGNILTPNLVGQSVGLHPVWLLFALSVFGALFGFVGMLVAVPVAAAIGVLARFGIEQYKQGLLYRGLEGLETPQPDPEPHTADTREET